MKLPPAKGTYSVPMTELAPGKIPARFQIWLLAAVLGLGTAALYWPALHHDFVDFDDNVYVSSNLHVRSGLTAESIKWAFRNTVSGNWHPITMLSHMLDCQLYGLQPWGHHLTSLGLHALNTVLVFLLLCRLTGAPWRSAGVAALFGWHPLHVESVAWVAERKDVLSAGFGFLALLLYVRHAQGRKPGDPSAAAEIHGSQPAFYFSSYYWLAWFCLALGLMSKPMLVTWPFVMLLLDYWLLERFQSGAARSLVLEKIPFLALAAVASVITCLVQAHAGATRAMENIPLEMRSENALVSYCRYLSKIFWPHDLAVFYPYPPGWSPGLVLLAGVFLCGLTALLWTRRRGHPALLTGWLWFLGTLVPVIGLVQVGRQAMADRYTYIPSVGLFLAVVWGVCDWSRHWRHRAIPLSVASLAALIICLVLTRQQLGYWQNSETLFRHALAVTADNDVARNNLGLAFLSEGQTNLAMSEFKRAVQLNPAAFEAHENIGDILAKQGDTDAAALEYQETIRLKPDYADPHNNLGILAAIKGRNADAIAQYQEAIRLNPEFADAHYNLGKLLAQEGRADAAANEFQAAIRIQPNDVESRFKLGSLLAQQGRADDAIDQFQAVIKLKPDFAEAHGDLGTLLAAEGRTDEAIQQFQAALHFNPDYRDAHYNLGNAFLKTGEIDQAISQYQAVVHLSPGFAPAHYYLGVALTKKGRAGDAINEFQEVIRLKPNDALAHDKLGIVLGENGRIDEAIREFQEAVRLQPDFAEATNNLARALALKNASTNR